MKTIIRDTVPCWWKLGWSPNDNSLLIHVAKAFISALPAISPNSPLILAGKSWLAGDLFRSFSCSLTESHFGFNQSIKRVADRNTASEFATFSVLLPKVHRATGRACPDCGGTGKRERGDRCLLCNGSKMEMVYDWDTAFNITGSIQLLFWLLDLEAKTEMPTQTPQWMALNLWAERGMAGSSLGGHLSKDGVRMFKLLIRTGSSPVKKLEKRVTTALAQSWTRMMGKGPYGNYNLRAEIKEDDCNLFLTCPGDAAGAYTLNQQSNLPPEHGCEISSHNMDSPAQALACLAGLAVFCEELEMVWNEQEQLCLAR